MIAAAAAGDAPAATGAVEYAGWPRRAVAWSVDALILWAAALLLGATPVLGFLTLPLFPAYFTVAHGRPSGRTPGKAAVGVAVRDARTFGPIGYGRALGRWLATALFWLPFAVATVVGFAVVLGAAFSGEEPELDAIIALWLLSAGPGVLDGLSPLWNERRRAWHDRLAGTIVVRL